MEPITAEGDVGKPDVLDFRPLNKPFFYLEIALCGSGVLNRSYECSHCFSGRVNGIAHRLIFIFNAKILRILAVPDCLSCDRIIHPVGCATSGSQHRARS